MIESPAAALPPETISALITTALRTRQRGDMRAARALLRALAARAPDTPRVWLALATVAETRDEQRQALERVIALDPQHPLARRGLAQLQARAASTASAAPSPPIAPDESTIIPAMTFAASEEPEAIPPEPEREIRWPLYALLGAAAAIILLALLLFRPWERADTVARGDPATTPLVAVIPAPLVVATALPANTSAPDAAPISSSAPPTSASIVAPLPTASAGSAPAPSAPPTNATQPTEAQPAQTALAPGTIVNDGDWHASLLFPEQAVLLDGSIGALQPRGRFVLALITLGNDGSAATRIPERLFTLVDGRGNRYQAQLAASTAYLAAYGRGQHGDLSMEDAVPNGGENVSIPLIFDVPTDARNLTLRVGASPQGWPIGDQ